MKTSMKKRVFAIFLAVVVAAGMAGTCVYQNSLEVKAEEEKEKIEMADMEIISKKVEEKVKDGKYILKADYICLMDIAEEQDILSDIPWENTDDMS